MSLHYTLSLLFSMCWYILNDIFYFVDAIVMTVHPLAIFIHVKTSTMATKKIHNILNGTTESPLSHNRNVNLVTTVNFLLPPANEGNRCLSAVHMRLMAITLCAMLGGACMVGWGHAWQGAYMAGDMHGRGVCGRVVHGRGHV